MNTFLENGTVIYSARGCWQIEKAAGRGGSAVVYQAKDLNGEGYAAIKELFPSSDYIRLEDGAVAADPDGLDRDGEALRMLTELMRSAEIMTGCEASRFNYQVIHVKTVLEDVKIKRPEDEEPHPVPNVFGVMDLLSGKGIFLEDWIRNHRDPAGRIPLEDALDMMLMTAGAYAPLHEDCILHGDCSRGNVYVAGIREGKEENGCLSAFILDLSGARRLKDGRAFASDGPILSTDGFRAPEVQDAISDPDTVLTAAADVWSLGALFLDLLTGGISSKGSRLQPALHMEDRMLPEDFVLSGDPEEPAIRSFVNEILLRSMDPDPSPQRRYQNAGELRKDLQRLKSLITEDAQAADLRSVWKAALKGRAGEKPSVYRDHPDCRLAPALSGWEIPVDVSVKNEDGEYERGLSEALEMILAAGKPKDCVMISGPTGCGKSFGAAKLMNRLLSEGRRIPFYLNLEECCLERYRDLGSEDLVITILNDRYFQGRDPAELKAFFMKDTASPEILVFADDLNNVPAEAFEKVKGSLAGLLMMPNVSLLVSGHSEEPLFGRQLRVLKLSDMNIVRQYEQVMEYRDSLEDPDQSSGSGIKLRPWWFAEYRLLSEKHPLLAYPMYLMWALEECFNDPSKPLEEDRTRIFRRFETLAKKLDSLDEQAEALAVLRKLVPLMARWLQTNKPDPERVFLLNALSSQKPENRPRMHPDDDGNLLVMELPDTEDRSPYHMGLTKADIAELLEKLEDFELPGADTVMHICEKSLGILERSADGSLLFAHDALEDHFGSLLLQREFHRACEAENFEMLGDIGYLKGRESRAVIDPLAKENRENRQLLQDWSVLCRMARSLWEDRLELYTEPKMKILKKIFANLGSPMEPGSSLRSALTASRRGGWINDHARRLTEGGGLWKVLCTDSPEGLFCELCEIFTFDRFMPTGWHDLKEDILECAVDIALEQGADDSIVQTMLEQSYYIEKGAVQTEVNCRKAIRYNYENFKYVQIQTERLCFFALDEYPGNFKYIRRQTPELCRYAVKSDEDNLALVKDDALREELRMYAEDPLRKQRELDAKLDAITDGILKQKEDAKSWENRIMELIDNSGKKEGGIHEQNDDEYDPDKYLRHISEDGEAILIPAGSRAISDDILPHKPKQ